MAKKQTKLELTWIGKDQRPRLEPRILIEDPEKSYHAAHRVSEDDIFDNRLVFGDNLLALKALEQEFTGKIKCIYIDPPYNTGSAFGAYEDGIEHSLWLSMMRNRLELLCNLLSCDGAIFVQLDDNEYAHCRVMMDEVFGRENFITTVVWEKSFSPRNNAVFFSTSHDFLIVYAKDKSQASLNLLPRGEQQNSRYKNPDDDPRGLWASDNILVSLASGQRGRQYQKTGHCTGLFDVQSPSGKVFSPPAGNCWRYSENRFKELDEDNRIWWGKDGGNMPRLKRFLSEVAEGVIPQTIWKHSESGHNQEANKELKRLFPNITDLFPTPKPERLIQRVIEIGSNPGDLILDSFAGSGTTGAVAHKMARRWIMVELEETCHTHIIPRLKKVIGGEDPGGVTEACEWKGGGGFRYYKLGPSLLDKDEWGNWVINKEFNAEMLAEAVCKLEGFVYAPSDEVYWQHGHSTETDFIYVTTQFMNREMLARLSDEVGENRSLLVVCKAFKVRPDAFENLNLKKIPKTVLRKCEWGQDDYSLEIRDLPPAPPEEEQESPPPVTQAERRKTAPAAPTLFEMSETGGEQ